MRDTRNPSEKENLRLAFQILIVLFVTVWPSTKPVSGNVAGPIGIMTNYAVDTGLCVISADIDSDLFLMNSFNNKYRIVRFVVRNRSNQLIKLDPAKDEIHLLLPSRNMVRGILDLQAADANTWGSLDENIRRKLAYPSEFRAISGEVVYVVYIYAFFPSDKVPDMPAGFMYKIHSLGGNALRIYSPQKAKK